MTLTSACLAKLLPTKEHVEHGLAEGSSNLRKVTTLLPLFSCFWHASAPRTIETHISSTLERSLRLPHELFWIGQSSGNRYNLMGGKASFSFTAAAVRSRQPIIAAFALETSKTLNNPAG